MFKLSIMVITMNRCEQLSEALSSCLACNLPCETEFVILDNASIDRTEDVVTEALSNSGYKYCYERVAENLGVGGGRCYAYQKTSGEYVYVLDDDAVIDYEKNPDFFVKAIDLLDKKTDVITLTTQIFDTAWNANRVETPRRCLDKNLYKCMVFCGGSHFIRKSFFPTPPYLPNKYGWEEFLPSLRVLDVGKLNVFCPELVVIHKPRVNKWVFSDGQNKDLMINCLALYYSLKSMVYPLWAVPFVYMAYQLRNCKYVRNDKYARSRIKELIKEIKQTYPVRERIRSLTFFKMLGDFGMKIL